MQKLIKLPCRIETNTMTFGPVVALDRVDLTVKRGEVRGLIGENGSGKSTVTSIFSGMQPADSGEMFYKGQPWKPESMHWAAAHGVGMIVQETGTVPEITVAENMFLCQTGRFAMFKGKNGKRWGPVSNRAMVKAAQKALDDIGASHIRANAMTYTLDMQDRKLVEVAKVWMQDPKLIVVEIKNANLGDQMADFTLQAHEGEILGIGGLSHCGMHTVGKVLFGDIKPASGTVKVYTARDEGEEIHNPAFAMKRGIGYVAKDRDVESLNTQTSIRDNISIAGLDKIAIKNFLILYGREKAYVEKQRDNMQIKCFSIDQEVSQLSGGNKQKVVFGKWIGAGSNILILDCPTRGLDVGVKQAMYHMMYDMKKQGKTIIMISEEMTELMGMSDRLVIMKDGRIMKEFDRSPDLTDAEIIKYMI